MIVMKIEYKQLVTDKVNVSVEDLNTLGEDRWQLITVVKLGDEIGTYGTQAGHYMWTFSRTVFG